MNICCRYVLLDLNVLYQLHIWNVTIQYRLSSQEIYCISTAFVALGMAYVCGKESHVFIRYECFLSATYLECHYSISLKLTRNLLYSYSFS